MQLFFVWLGSKRAEKNGVGRKGSLLDLAMRRGLPVPNGGILLDAFYQLCLEEKVAVVTQEYVRIPQPRDLAELLFTAVRFPQLNTNVAVRTSSRAKTQGQVLPQLNINTQEPQQLATTLEMAWTTLAASPRKDLLLMEMVCPQVAGTALLESDSEENQITIVGQPDNAQKQFALPQLRGWGRGKTGGPAYRQRLQMLLRGVERTFGDEVRAVEWIDDGNVCWLLELD